MATKVVRRLDRETLLAELRQYEERYGMSSEVFLQRWRHGDASLDQPGYFAWIGLCRMAVRRGLLKLGRAEQPLPA